MESGADRLGVRVVDVVEDAQRRRKGDPLGNFCWVAVAVALTAAVLTALAQSTIP